MVRCSPRTGDLDRFPVAHPLQQSCPVRRGAGNPGNSNGLRARVRGGRRLLAGSVNKFDSVPAARPDRGKRWPPGSVSQFPFQGSFCRGRRVRRPADTVNVSDIGRRGGAAKMETGGHPEGNRPPLPPPGSSHEPCYAADPPRPRGPALPLHYPRNATFQPACEPVAIPLRQASSFPRVSFQRVILTRPAPAQGAQQPEGRKEERQGGRHGHGAGLPRDVAGVRTVEGIICPANLVRIAILKGL